MKKKVCNGCEEEKVIWKNYDGNKYCQYCWNKIKYKKDPPKPKKQIPIQPRSKKRKFLDTAYSKLRKDFLSNNSMCQASLPGCQNNACDVHHKKGRGKWYLVVSTWLAVCRPCHEWIEHNPIEATELGFRESKLTD